jgi:ribonuclease R
MIAANEAVAEFLEQSGVPSLYRIHEEPDPMKLDDIIRVLTSIGIIRDRKGIKSGDFSGLLEKIKDTPQEEIINHMVLRSLKQAKYSTVNIGHFGLASESYTHFTSPIRRYPDLVVHRILREVLTNKSLSNDRIRELETMLPDIAFNSSRTERLADEAERSVLNAMRVWFMKDKVGEEFEGKVASVTPYGLKIRLKDYYVEGFLHVSYMTDDYYQYDEKTLSLSGLNKKRRYTIGDLIRVRIDRVDMEAREIVMGI